MDRDLNKVAWPGIAGLIALAATVGLWQRTDVPAAPAAQPGRPAGVTRQGPDQGIATMGGRQAFALIADALNVSLAQQDAVIAIDRLREHLASHPSADDARDRRALASLDMLRATAAQGLAGRNSTQRQNALNSLAEVEGYAAQRPGFLSTAVASASDGPSATLAGIARHVRATADEDTYRFLQSAARTRHVRGLQFLIASIPDYVDSNSDWMTDDLLDAIQRAANKAGFILDRFYFPDGPDAGVAAAGDGAPLAGRSHESEPGVLLFKKFDHRDLKGPDAGAALEHPAVDMLLVFLVTETATAGVHQSAFLHAAQFIQGWRTVEGQNAETDGNVLEIVGPTFSGTSVSLRGALETFLCAPSLGWPRSVRVISGTATDLSNRQVLTFRVARGSPDCGSDTRTASASVPASRSPESAVEVTFNATVRSDQDLLGALRDYLGSLNPAWRDGTGVAFLHESTAYGLQFSNSSQTFGLSLMRSVGEEPTAPFPRALTLSFPLHISRLRGVTSGAQVPAGRSAGLSLRMDQRSVATDMLPSVTPGLTLATVELSLANILATIVREKITAVGIFATDKRDHLFLSREIVKAAPNVLLFTTEGHLLFTHPDYSSFVRGTVVASSYSLFNATQVLADHAGAAVNREQFSNNGAEGVYNAALSLIAPWEPLLDYAPLGRRVDCSPGGATEKPDETCIPPVWMTVVGRDALWPVRVMPSSPTGNGYVLSAYSGWTPALGVPNRPLVAPPPWVYAAVTLATTLAVVHVCLFVFAAPGGRWGASVRQWAQGRAHAEIPVLRLLDHTEEDIPVERRRFLLCCAVTSGGVALWMLFHAWLAWTGTPPPGWAAAGIVGLLAAGLALAVVGTARDRLRALGAINDLWDSSSWLALARGQWIRATAVGVVMASMAGMAAYYLGWHAVHAVGQSAIDAQLALARALEPSSGVSPVPAVILLGAALYAWALWHAQQLSMRAAVGVGQADSGLFRFVCGSESAGPASREGDPMAGHPSREPLRHELAQVLASPWRRSPVTLLVVVAVLVAAYGLVSRGDGHAIDGWELSGFLWWATWLAVFVTVHALSQTVHLSMLLFRMLRHLRAQHIGPALTRVAQNHWLEWRLSPRANRVVTLMPAVRLAESLAGRLIELARDGGPAAVLPAIERRRASVPIAGASVEPARTTPVALRLRVRVGDLGPLVPALNGLHGAEARIAAEPDEAFPRSDVWAQLVALTSALVPVLLHGRWRRPDSTSEGAVAAWQDTAENLIALQAAFIIRDVLSRVVGGLGVVLVISFLILGGHLFYAFQGRQLFIWLDLTLMGAVAAVGATILVTLERDRVLSQLWSTDPGRINWNGGFVYRIALYVGVPFLAILAAQFPELGGSLASWLEPLQKALP